MTVAGLVLAAGAGRRMGGPKALVDLDGEPLLSRAVRTLQAAGCAPVLVVLGASADEVRDRVALDDACVVVNDAWQEGLGSSLRAGLATLAQDTTARAAVALLVDQPDVPASLVVRLVDAWRAGARAAVATYDGEQRNPVVLDASLWQEVGAAAQGDVGARGYLRAHPEVVVEVACDDLGSAVDLDTTEDLERYRQRRRGDGV